MKSDDSNPRSGAVPGDPGDLEAKITAKLLGELSPEEIAGLNEVIAGNPELALLEERLRRTLDWVCEATAMTAEPSDGVGGVSRMSPDRRGALLERLRGPSPGTDSLKAAGTGAEAGTAVGGGSGAVIPTAFDGPQAGVAPGWRGTWLALAACLVGLLVVGSLMLETVPDLESRSRRAGDLAKFGAPEPGVVPPPPAAANGVASSAVREDLSRGVVTGPAPFAMQPQLMRRYGLVATSVATLNSPAPANEPAVQLTGKDDDGEPLAFSMTVPPKPGQLSGTPAGQPVAGEQAAVQRASRMALEVAQDASKLVASSAAIVPATGGGFGGGGGGLEGRLGAVASSRGGVARVAPAAGVGGIVPQAPGAVPGSRDMEWWAGVTDRNGRGLADSEPAPTRERFAGRRLQEKAGLTAGAAKESLSKAKGLGLDSKAVPTAEAETGEVFFGRLVRPNLPEEVVADAAVNLVADESVRSEGQGDALVRQRGVSASAQASDKLGVRELALGDVPVLGQAFAAAPSTAGVAGGLPGLQTAGSAAKFDTEERLAETVTVTNLAYTPSGQRTDSFSFVAPRDAAPAVDARKAAAEPVLVRELKRAAPAPDVLVPQPEVVSEENNVSTFSLNVSDVSFKLAAASLDQGQLPAAASVRTEEFVNAFDYRDPEAAPGQPLAFAWERARYPFTPQRDVLRLAVRTAASGREAGRPMNVVLVLDASGSMERADRVATIREALRSLGSLMKAEDRVSVVTFARSARLWIDGLPGSQASELVERIGHLVPEGGTHLEDALTVGYEAARKHFMPAGINRLVLLTDGAANLGEVRAEALRSLVETNRRRGIALDCFGVGFDGYQDELLEALSRNGDGRYGFVNTPEEAATGFVQQLAGALNVAASDVKVQVEFNPRRVTIWRQIGYARHQLTKEQFRNDTVDAAEISAAESGNALYMIETDPRGEGPVATVRARYRDPESGRVSEHEWAVPYDGQAVALEQASPAMRLAGCAAAFGEMLAGSPFAGEVSAGALLSLMNGVPEALEPDPRPGQLVRMLGQAQSILGR